MGHRGPVLKPGCIRPGRALTQILFSIIAWIAYASIESKFVQLRRNINLLAATSNLPLETDICPSYVTPAVTILE